MLTFSTLGPAGSNHHFVLDSYLIAHGLQEAACVTLFDDFHKGAAGLIAKRSDYMLQCAAHPDTADITGGYRKAFVVVDAFVSPSRPMALVRAKRSSLSRGRVGVQPATQRYANLGHWPTVIHADTVLAVQDGLLEGQYEAGITFESFVTEHPAAFEVVEYIGSVSDAWIVYGRESVDEGKAVIWTESPIAGRYREVRS